MEITWRVLSGEGEGRSMGENVQGRRSIFSRHKIDGERYKWYRKLKEHICTMHGHELIGVECWRVGGCMVEEE